MEDQGTDEGTEKMEGRQKKTEDRQKDKKTKRQAGQNFRGTRKKTHRQVRER